MTYSRTIEPELLDTITADDPRAIRARYDLRRVNTIMGHTKIWKRLLHERISPEQNQLPVNIVELGSGDGTLMLQLARTLATQWPRSRLFLTDRHPAVNNKTLDAFAALGWQVVIVEADIMDWINNMPRCDLVVANLLLHHFNDRQLAGLFSHIAGRTGFFAACEPRRSSFALLGSHLLGLIGCGPVARYDAVVSVHAGFSGTELSALWPDRNNWQIKESGAGLFSHTFIAQHPLPSKQAAPP